MRARGYETWVVTAALLWAGCATGGGGDYDAGQSRLDAGRTDGGAADGGPADAGRDAGPPVDAHVPMTDAGGIDAGAPDAGTPDAGMPTCPPTAERVAIVEVMIASQTGSGDRGEWLEIVNAGDCTVDLGGLEIASPIGGTAGTGLATYTISAGRMLAPGARIVLAQSATPAENHGLSFDEVYTSLVFDNGGDWIELRNGGTTIDRVEWIANDVVVASSRRFPDGRSIADNSVRTAWCTSTAAYSTLGGEYRGTPRTANGTCP